MSNTPRGLPLTSSRVQDIYPKLTSAQISRLSVHGQMRALQADEVLYEQGDIAVPFFVVVSGLEPSMYRGSATGYLAEKQALQSRPG